MLDHASETQSAEDQQVELQGPSPTPQAEKLTLLFALPGARVENTQTLRLAEAFRRGGGEQVFQEVESLTEVVTDFPTSQIRQILGENQPQEIQTAIQMIENLETGSLEDTTVDALVRGLPDTIKSKFAANALSLENVSLDDIQRFFQDPDSIQDQRKKAILRDAFRGFFKKLVGRALVDENNALRELQSWLQSSQELQELQNFQAEVERRERSNRKLNEYEKPSDEENSFYPSKNDLTQNRQMIQSNVREICQAAGISIDQFPLELLIHPKKAENLIPGWDNLDEQTQNSITSRLNQIAEVFSDDLKNKDWNKLDQSFKTALEGVIHYVDDLEEKKRQLQQLEEEKKRQLQEKLARLPKRLLNAGWQGLIEDITSERAGQALQQGLQAQEKALLEQVSTRQKAIELLVERYAYLLMYTKDGEKMKFNEKQAKRLLEIIRTNSPASIGRKVVEQLLENMDSFPEDYQQEISSLLAQVGVEPGSLRGGNLEELINQLSQALADDRFMEDIGTDVAIEVLGTALFHGRAGIFDKDTAAFMMQKFGDKFFQRAAKIADTRAERLAEIDPRLRPFSQKLKEAISDGFRWGKENWFIVLLLIVIGGAFLWSRFK